MLLLVAVPFFVNPERLVGFSLTDPRTGRTLARVAAPTHQYTTTAYRNIGVTKFYWFDGYLVDGYLVDFVSVWPHLRHKGKRRRESRRHELR